MNPQGRMLRDMAARILRTAHSFEWSLQGFGMLRLHLSDEVRLNVWDSRFSVTDVSLIHTHPWNFESVVVAGELRNRRYRESELGSEYDFAEIKPGPGGGLLQNGGRVKLLADALEIYGVGDSYRQLHSEIHLSSPKDGTVTINYRERVGADLALVYWPAGERWVSAEPRPASSSEVEVIVSNALEKF